MDPIETLIRLLLQARIWPLPSEQRIRQKLTRWMALRESDERLIRTMMDWPSDRKLLVDNLPEKIADAYGSLLFGEEPEARAAVDGDADFLEALFEANRMPSDFQAAEGTVVSEGESWWRWSVHPALPHPTLTWHSRYDVLPLLHGRQPIAVAFISRYGDPTATEQRPTSTVYRHFEIHGPGRMMNLLFEGRGNALGRRVDLGKHPLTAELAEDWRHELPMLAGRIVNRFGRDVKVGRSIYEGVWQRLLALNEGVTIGRENMRLTAKKRAVVPASALRPRRPQPGDDMAPPGVGRPTDRPAVEFDAGEDVLVHDPLDVDESRGDAGGPFKVLEYTFDADQLIAWLRHEVETVCQRCDLVPQFIGSGDFGLSGASGISLRVRLLPTVNAAEARGRAWDDDLPRIVALGQQLEALPKVLGGLGVEGWSDPQEEPSVERAHALPEDPTELAERHATLASSQLISVRQSLVERYPKWSDEQIDAEVERIRSDRAASLPSASFGLGAGGNAGEPPAADGGNT